MTSPKIREEGINKRNKPQTGFTTIELLVAIFVLVVGIIGVLNVFPLGIQVAKSSQVTAVAIQLAQGKMEDIASKSYDDIAGESKQQLGSPFNAYSSEVDVSCFDPNAGILPDCPDTGIKQVKVIISWELALGIGSKKVEASTFVARK